ncbi:DUF29 domain-containing protein [Roseicella aquatilis]|nr:DUF29 domain-containing protein [Roseicella aquatilis]
MGETSLYDTDILAWTEEQAAALRALAGRPDLPNALDLPNVIEEIETLGRTELKAATSPIRLILLHLLKVAFVPDSQAEAHWRTEIVTWHGDVQDNMTISMHQRVDMDALWRRALREAGAALRENGAALPRTLPGECPFGLEDFLGETFDTDAAVARLRALAAP